MRAGLKTKLTGELSLPSEHFITNVPTLSGKYISFNTKNQTINIMKNSLKALVVVALLAFAGMANAQNSASATATANATIVCPISITNYANLEFGTITNSSTGGTVVVPSMGSTVYTGVAATTGTHAGAAPHAAGFTVGGQGDFGYSIAATITTVMSGGSGSAVLSNLEWSIPNSFVSQVPGNISSGNSWTGSIFPCDIDNDGDAYYQNQSGDDGGCGCVTDDLKVGGTLTLDNAANGTFAGVIDVAVAYN